MKFFYSCAFLVVLFAASQASPLFGLPSLKDTVDSAIDTGKSITGRVTSDAKEIVGKVTDINAIVGNLVTDSVSKLLDNIFKVFQNTGKSVSAVEDAIKNAKTEVGDKLKNMFQGVAEQALNKVQEVTGEPVVDQQAFTEEVQSGVSNLIDNFLKSFDTAAEGAKAIKEKLLEQQSKVSELVKERVQKLVTDFVEKTKGLTGVGKSVIAAKQKAVEDLVSGISQLQKDVTSKLGSVLEEAKNIKDQINQTQVEKVRELVEGARNLMRSVAEKFTQAKEKIPEVVAGLNNVISSQISSAVGVIQQGIKFALSGVDKVLGFAGSAVDTTVNLVTGTIQGVANVATGTIKAGAGTAKSIVGGVASIPSKLIG